MSMGHDSTQTHRTKHKGQPVSKVEQNESQNETNSNSDVHFERLLDDVTRVGWSHVFD